MLFFGTKPFNVPLAFRPAPLTNNLVTLRAVVCAGYLAFEVRAQFDGFVVAGVAVDVIGKLVGGFDLFVGRGVCDGWERLAVVARLQVAGAAGFDGRSLGVRERGCCQHDISFGGDVGRFQFGFGLVCVVAMNAGDSGLAVRAVILRAVRLVIESDIRILV